MDIREKIAQTHITEKELMVENGKLDKEIRIILNKKNKLKKSCSKLVLYRNRLINILKNNE